MDGTQCKVIQIETRDLPCVVKFVPRAGGAKFYQLMPSRDGNGMSMQAVKDRVVWQLRTSR